MMLPRILFAYLALFQVILMFVSYFMNQDSVVPLALDSATFALIAFGFVAFALGFILPGRLIGRIKAPGAGTSHPLSAVITPYMIRLALFEVCTLIGFVAGFLHQDWQVMVPFLILGLVGTLASIPSEAFFEKLRNG